MVDNVSRSSRRAFLATAGTALATASAGCVDRFISTSARESPSSVSLSVLTPPADDDEGAVRIARQLVDNLSTAGVDASLRPESGSELNRDFLVNQDFQVVVTEHARFEDPDRLRTLLYSTYTDSEGWTNPFGYSNLDTDELLDRQRRSVGEDRVAAVREVLDAVVRDQPFSVVAVPDYHAIATPSVAFEAGATTLQRPLDYLSVRPPDDSSDLRVAMLDGGITLNRNPLAVEYHERGAVLGTVYDPLGRWVNDRVIPWLASDWEFVDDGPNPRLSVDLREDLRWHDGEPLRASDVAFSFRFLADTSLGNADDPVPAPRFRGRESLVAGVEVDDHRSFTLEFTDCSPDVAKRALTSPVLPKHVWSAKSSLRKRLVTEALVWENRQPIGSGPLKFAGAEDGQSVTFVRNDDHFLFRDDLEGPATRFAGRPAFERIEFVVSPSSGAAVQLVSEGSADALGSPLNGSLERAREDPEVSLAQDESWSWYLLGFNARKSHLSNPRFRRAVARLVDRTHVARTVLDGNARPANVPPIRDEYVPESLYWSGEHALGPFPGSDGDVDTEAARDLFRDVGYRYDDGTLVAG